MNRKNCFVLMPDEGNFAGNFANIYKQAIEETGLIARKTEGIYSTSPNINKIWDFVCSSDIILADLTSKDPNIMYQLGLAQAIQKPTILISENLEDVPFDLKNMSIILFDKKISGWEIKLKEDIILFLKNTIKAPLESVLPIFIKTKPNEAQTVSEFQKDIIEIKQILSLIKIKNKPKTIESKAEKTELNADLMIEATNKSNKLYFENGNDLISIKSHLIDHYKVSLALAETVINKAIENGPKD